MIESLLIHDLKNILSGITGAVDLFSEGLLGELTKEQKTYMEEIRLSSKLLAGFIEDLQHIIDIEEGKLKLERKPIAVEDILKKLFWLNEYAANENKNIKIEAPNHLTIFADQELIVRILTNFILNALRQSKERQAITLIIRQEKDQIRFSVEDEGEGLEKKYLKKIFDKTFKTDNPKLRFKAGIGLGLYLCKLAVELHGGQIGAESGVGKGSRFYFSL